MKWFGWMVEIQSKCKDCDDTVGINEASHVSWGLFVCALRFLKEIEEVKGLHLLSIVRKLSLSWSRGLRRLPDLWCMPKLEQICAHGCCKL